MATPTITGAELRLRLEHLGLTYRTAAERLGLTPGALHHQTRGVRKVSRQTVLLLETLEREHGCSPKRTGW